MKRLALLVAAALLLSGCTGTPAVPEPHPVTAEESQLLAIARFHNFDAGSRPFRTEITERGSQLTVRGWVDYQSGLGYAAVTGSFEPSALLWGGDQVGILPQPANADGFPTLPIPATDADWRARPLDPAGSRLDALLAALSALGADRPDNPLLVQQSGGFWIRDDTVDGTPVTVFGAPPSDEPPAEDAPPITADTSPLRLWVNESGLILRAELLIGGAWVTVDFPDIAGEPLEVAP